MSTTVEFSTFRTWKPKSSDFKYRDLSTFKEETSSKDTRTHETILKVKKILVGKIRSCGFLLTVIFLVLIVILAVDISRVVQPDQAQDGYCNLPENNRFDCWPEKAGITERGCVNRGCCWQPPSRPDGASFCFFPPNYEGYSAESVEESSLGINVTLSRSSETFFSSDVKTLKLAVEYQTDTRLRIKFYDPSNRRYEVPLDVPAVSGSVMNPLYKVTVQKRPFSIVVTRKSTGATIFDTTGVAPLIFSDQYLQIGTRLSSQYLYGFGEYRNPFLQNITSWKRLAFWTRQNDPETDSNGYGAHPHFMNLESQGNVTDSHGVFLLNSNAGEVALQPFGQHMTGAVTYRFLGGILDFYLVLGPQPTSVVSQFAEITGLPYLPPFWSLGYHICKSGIKKQEELVSMITRNRDAQMPYDVQCSDDVDYMDEMKVFTYSKINYNKLSAIVADLHANQQRYIPSLGPAISSEEQPGTYPPFDDGRNMNIFTMNATGDIIIGAAWSGKSAFPDFFHYKSFDYWNRQVRNFYEQISFDGLWLKMNEPSSFVAGSTLGCTKNSLDTPPFTPPSISSLSSKTLCPSAKHAVSSHYDMHNMYGWTQTNVTRAVLDELFPNKRSPIITRSTFSGSGKFAGHWLGDSDSSYIDMYYSIPGILNFNLLGIPFVGVDVCGFHGLTTAELCTRWHQLGVFYPFLRNHAVNFSPYQDPASFEQPYQDYIRTALQLRYRLLAVLYTAFFRTHTEGLPIVTPLFFKYPNTESIDRQFVWADRLLVSPVLNEGDDHVSAYFPQDLWYDFYNGTQISQTGQYVWLDAPIDRINIHIRGGSILPLLPPTQRTDISRQQPLQLVVAPEKTGMAEGELFWDDGESADSVPTRKYSHITFSFNYTSKQFQSKATVTGYIPADGLRLSQVQFLDIAMAPDSVQVNEKNAVYSYGQDSKVLKVTQMDEDLLQPVTITWA